MNFLRIILFSFLFSLVLSTAFSLDGREDQGERIQSFKSVITVNTDSSLRVEETIRVFVTGDNIKHGIYRDFPTRIRNPLGFFYTARFDFLGAEKDGEPEEYSVKDIDNGVRIYLGSKNIVLPNYKSYTYRLVYLTDHQIWFTTNYDELYWNVTGNEWNFAIDEASAVVILPKGAQKTVSFTGAYTGLSGSKETNYYFSNERSGLHFRTTEPLGDHQGLTVLVRWGKGFLREPPKESQWKELVRENRGEFTGILGLLLVFFYYFIAWVIFGRDPKKGVIMPQFEAPEKLSPAAVRFIMKMGYDNEAFAASIVNMAVKGYLKIIESKSGEFSVEKVSEKTDDLSEEEKKLGDTLFQSTKSFHFKQSNHGTVSLAIEKLKKSLKASYEKNYFIKNAGLFVVGTVLSICSVIYSYVAGGKGEGFPILIWLTFWTLGILPLIFMVFNNWGQFIRDKGMKKIADAGTAIFLTLFSIPFLVAEVVVGGFYLKMASVWMVLIVVGTLLLNLVFYHLLKAPTRAGRKVMDKIAGFKMFLSATEKDKLERIITIEKNRVNYERFLPYAIALDVEEKWTAQFKEALATSEALKSSPGWYSGASWSALGAAGFSRALGSSFAGAIGSSSVSPSSGGGSGGGGGGSSGGGGGGGGGGGW